MPVRNIELDNLLNQEDLKWARNTIGQYPKGFIPPKPVLPRGCPVLVWRCWLERGWVRLPERLGRATLTPEGYRHLYSLVYSSEEAEALSPMDNPIPTLPLTPKPQKDGISVKSRTEWRRAGKTVYKNG